MKYVLLFVFGLAFLAKESSKPTSHDSGKVVLLNTHDTVVAGNLDGTYKSGFGVVAYCYKEKGSNTFSSWYVRAYRDNKETVNDTVVGYFDNGEAGPKTVKGTLVRMSARVL